MNLCICVLIAVFCFEFWLVGSRCPPLCPVTPGYRPLRITMAESGTTKEERIQLDMDGATSEQISMLGLQRELDDLKESVEYAHQNNIRTQTQVGNFISQSQTVNDRLCALEREVTSLKRYSE